MSEIWIAIMIASMFLVPLTLFIFCQLERHRLGGLFSSQLPSPPELPPLPKTTQTSKSTLPDNPVVKPNPEWVKVRSKELVDTGVFNEVDATGFAIEEAMKGLYYKEILTAMNFGKSGRPIPQPGELIPVKQSTNNQL